MSTRGSICIKLKDEDLDKDLHMKDKLGHDLNVVVHPHSGFPYMYVYCHHDSYIDKPGLGFFLPRKLQTYEEVRDFILQGDRTSFGTPYTECGEDAEDLQPNFSASVDGPIPEEYFYLFNDGKWYVKDVHGHDNFIELEYQPQTIELNEREAATVKFIIDKYLKIRGIFEDIPESHDAVYMMNINHILKKFKEENI